MTDRTIPILAIAVLGGAVAGGLAALAVAPGGSAEPARSVVPDGAAHVSTRLEALAAENRDLRERLEALEVRPALSPPPAPARAPLEDWVTRAELEALRDELEQRASGPGSVASAPEPLKAQVAEVLEQVRFEEQVEGVRASHEKRVARLDQDVDVFTERLELSPAQSDELRRALLTQYDRETDLTRRWEEGVDAAILGEEKGTIYTEFQTDLESFLTPDQVQGFWQTAKGG